MKIKLFVFCLWAILPSVGFSQGIRFETGSFQEAVDKALREGKMIFADVYTSWCGPCKTMARDVFTRPEVGKFYNRYFVCYKINAEKGEGRELAARFKVNCYPTLLYLDPRQQIRHRFSGYVAPEEFIRRGKQALDKRNNWAALDEAYRQGNRQPGFIQEYLKVLKEAYLPYDRVANDFLSEIAPEKLLNPVYQKMLEDYLISMDNPVFSYILTHRDEFSAVYNPVFIDDILERCIQESITTCLQTKDFKSHREYCRQIAATGWTGKEKCLLWAEKEYYKANEDWDNYFRSAVVYLEKYTPENWIETWKFVRQFINDPVPFREEVAVPYAAKAVKLMPNYTTFMTYARVLYRTGNPAFQPEILGLIEKAVQYETDHQTGRDLSPEYQFMEQVKKMDFEVNSLPDYVVTVQPVVACNDDGSCPASMALPLEMVNRVYEKTGIEFYFLPPVYWNCTDAREGKVNLDSLCRLAKNERIFKGAGDIVNMVFVDRIDGRGGPQGRGLFHGNITFITLGENGDSPENKALQTFVIAHEIGHNFGLQHVVDDPSVADSLPNIMGDGAYADRIDPFYSLTPGQIEIVRRSPLVRKRIDFLNKKEGQKAILDETFEIYFSQLQRREIMAFTGKADIPEELGMARDYLRTVFQQAVMEFTPEEQQLLTQVVNKVIFTLQNHHLYLMAEHPWRFIKIRGDICGGFAHTRGNCIILSEKHLQFLTGHKEEPLLLALQLGKLIVHEQLHVLQRTYPGKFRKLNTRYWNFIHARLEPTVEISENQVSNPDAPCAEWLVPGDGAYDYWPRVLFDEKADIPVMGKDFVEYAYPVVKRKDGFKLVKPEKNKRVLLTQLTGYKSAFPVKTGLDHPNEIAAYMFADYFEALLKGKTPFEQVVGPAGENVRRFLDWCEKEMSGDLPDRKTKALMTRLTLRDKIGMIAGEQSFNIKAFPEIGIPAVKMSDGPLGINGHGKATAFPAPVCMTATWNPGLIKSVGQAIGKEGKSKGIGVLLAPGVNMYRVPQCGRNFEYMGEDPYLASRTAVAYIQGVQSQGVMATVKHFAANNQDFDRHRYSSDIDERTLHEIYFPAFKAAVEEGQVKAVMTSYNLLNGVHTSESSYLIRDILRKEWKFKGIVMSDWISVYSTNVVNAGLDLEMPSGQFMNPDSILPLIQKGQVTPGIIEDKVKRIIGTCLDMDLYHSSSDTGQPDWDMHNNLACRVAEEGIVLLKNNGCLPLRAGVKKVAVIAPQVLPYSGGGAAHVTPAVAPDLFRQLQLELPDVRFTRLDVTAGYDTTLLEGISQFDAVVVNLGFDDQSEGEAFDRPFALPREQDIFMNVLCRLHPEVIVILTAGGGVQMPWSDRVAALLHSWYPGQAGDRALASILAGKTNPSGKLPVSIERRWLDNAASATYDTAFALSGAEPLYTLYGKPHEIKHMPYPEGIFTGYRHYDIRHIAPLFPFGYGLSYSRFRLSGLKISHKTISAGDTLEVYVTLKNVGKYEGKETVQLYVADPRCTYPRPLRELKAFQKVGLAPGKSCRICFRISRKELSFYDPVYGGWKAEPGEFKVYVGTSSRDLPLCKSFYLK